MIYLEKNGKNNTGRIMAFWQNSIIWATYSWVNLSFDDLPVIDIDWTVVKFVDSVLMKITIDAIISIEDKDDVMTDLLERLQTI